MRVVTPPTVEGLPSSPAPVEEESPSPYARTRGKELREKIGLISELELSFMLAISERALREWRKTGEGPRFVRAGRRTYYLMDDVREWLLGRRVTSDDPAMEMAD